MAGVSCRFQREMLIPGRSPAQRMIDRVESIRVRACESSAICCNQLDMDVASQAGRDLVLHVREIDPFLVEALSPQMCAALGINELRIDANSRAHCLNAALENISHAELATDLTCVGRLILVGPCGSARDHEEAR